MFYYVEHSTVIFYYMQKISTTLHKIIDKIHVNFIKYKYLTYGYFHYLGIVDVNNYFTFPYYFNEKVDDLPKYIKYLSHFLYWNLRSLF